MNEVSTQRLLNPYLVNSLSNDEYKDDKVLVTHRIISETANGYITKGDANESVDNWIVTQSDIIGVVKKKIKFIAWPSVWLSETFK